MMHSFQRQWSPARYVRGLAEVLSYVSDAIRAITAIVWAVTLIGALGFIGVLIWHVLHH